MLRVRVDNQVDIPYLKAKFVSLAFWDMEDGVNIVNYS